jgi:UDP-N-acetylglucosamine diphosphorylase/glucosamine-1-phosphate N-acetyltransferase
MRICIADDRRAADLGPLTATRPASDLLCGLTTLAEKQARFFRAERVGYLVRPELAGLLRARDPAAPVNDPAWLRAAPTVLVNSRWLAPPPPFPGPAYRDLFSGGTAVGVCGAEVAFAAVGTRQLQAVSPETVDDCLADWAQALPGVDAGGHVVRRPWELVDLNPGQIAADFGAACDPTAAGFHPAGFALVGPADRLFLHPTARIDPMVVADTTAGPVWIGPGAVVTAFTRLEGPCAVGPHTHLFGARVKAGTTLGPHCRVGGEVEASVALGYVNKYHDGFLGHSYLGEWVNLAAGTSTADLRFDYRPVTVKVNGEAVDTGRAKVGAVVGDHARTGLGVLLDAGAVVGPFAAVLPTGVFAPRQVPGFAVTGPDGSTPAPDLESLFAAADRAMRRRGRELTPELRAVYAAASGRRLAAADVEPPTLPLRQAA